MHKAGFVNIVGNPNVGKSTLMNSLVVLCQDVVTQMDFIRQSKQRSTLRLKTSQEL